MRHTEANVSKLTLKRGAYLTSMAELNTNKPLTSLGYKGFVEMKKGVPPSVLLKNGKKRRETTPAPAGDRHQSGSNFNPDEKLSTEPAKKISTPPTSGHAADQVADQATGQATIQVTDQTANHAVGKAAGQATNKVATNPDTDRGHTTDDRGSTGQPACGDGPLDEKSLNILITKNKDRLFRFILKNTGNPVAAQDLLQQTFVEALKNYRGFRGDSKATTWMFGIARNVVRNYIYRSPHKRYSFVGEETLLNEPSAEHNPEQAIECKEHMAHIEDAIHALPKKLRDVLVSVAFHELSYDDAGHKLRISIGTVRSRLSRARAFLRRKLNSRSLPPGTKLPRRLGGDLYDSIRQSFSAPPSTLISNRDEMERIRSQDHANQKTSKKPLLDSHS